MNSTNMTALTDEELMDGVRVGNSAAFDTLLARHGKSLFNFILRHVGNVTEAEDLLQTTFVKILQAAPSFDSRQKFTTWAYRIASNLCVDFFRRQQYRKAVSLDEPVRENDETTLADSIADERPPPSLRYEEKQLHAHVRRAIQTLTEEQRAVVLLCHYEGLSYPEIAATLGIPVGTVKSRMHNAMQRLRQQLQEWM